MSHKAFALISFTVLTMCGAGDRTARSADDPALWIDRPFLSSTAVDNLNTCLRGRITQDQLEQLYRIKRISYNFDPPMGGAGGRQGPDVRISRTVSFDISELALPTIVGQVRRADSDACETTVRTSYITEQIPDNHHVIVTFHVDAELWDCGSFLGINYKTDMGGTSFDVKLVYAISDNLQVTAIDPQISNVSQSSNSFFDLLGLVDPISFGVGQIIENTVRTKLQKAMDVIKAIGPDAGDPHGAFFAMSEGLKSVRAYVQTLDLSDLYPLVTDGAVSGLMANQTTNPEFDLVARTSVVSMLGPLAYTQRKQEIEFIRELAIPSPRTYVTRRGDNLWQIAKEFYMDPRIYIHLEDLNLMRKKPLPIGRSITLPLLYELCADVAINDSLVRPTDTIEKIRSRHGAAFHPRARDFRSGSLNLIYPYEGIRLSSPGH
jgi:hypothetical protein